MQRVFGGNHQRGFSLNDRARGWDDAVAISRYQPLWALRFAIEARVLSESLQPLDPQIEHVGSTAVPGLLARPIIDIAVGLPRPALVGLYVQRLRNFGYVPAEPDFGPPTFVRREGGVRTHQVLLVAADGAVWHALLALRDRLRTDLALALEYAAMKEPLAGRAPAALSDYRVAKAAFFRRVLPADVTTLAA